MGDPANRFNADRFAFDMSTGRFSQGPAARYLGISPAFLKQLIDRGQAPPFHQIGTLRIFLREDLDRWIAARRVEPTPGPQVQIRASKERITFHATKDLIPVELYDVLSPTDTRNLQAVCATESSSGPGVYFLCASGKVVYVGQTIDRDGRLKDHRQRGMKFDSVFWLPCKKERLDDIEAHFIRILMPSLNKRGNPSCIKIRTASSTEECA